MKIKELLSDASRWTQHAFARDTIGRNIYTNAEEAYSYCLLGAAMKCYPPTTPARILIKIKEEIECESILDWNDAPERTFEEVKALVEKLDI